MIVLLIHSLCPFHLLLVLTTITTFDISLHTLFIDTTDLAHCRSMDQVFSIIRLSLTCVLIILLLTGLYLLYPTNIKINLIASNNAPKLVNGLTVLESAI